MPPSHSWIQLKEFSQFSHFQTLPPPPQGFLIACSTLKFLILRMTSNFPTYQPTVTNSVHAQTYHTPTLIVKQLPIKVGQRDACLALLDFSRSNLHTLLYVTVNSSSIPLFTYNSYSKEYILVVTQEPDALFLPPCPKHCFVLENMIQ